MRRWPMPYKSRIKKTGSMIVLLFLLAGLTLSVLQPVARADGSTSAPGNSSKPPSLDGRPGTWPPADSTAPQVPFVPQGFAGTWYAFVDNTAFTLTIEQEGQRVKLAHTAIYDYGRRVDSSVGGVSMVGTVQGSIAYIDWKSGLSPENGRATLEYLPGRPETLHWKIVDEPKRPEDQSDSSNPSEIAYFLPAAAFLIRK